MGFLKAHCVGLFWSFWFQWAFTNYFKDGQLGQESQYWVLLDTVQWLGSLYPQEKNVDMAKSSA